MKTWTKSGVAQRKQSSEQQATGLSAAWQQKCQWPRPRIGCFWLARLCFEIRNCAKRQQRPEIFSQQHRPAWKKPCYLEERWMITELWLCRSHLAAPADQLAEAPWKQKCKQDKPYCWSFFVKVSEMIQISFKLFRCKIRASPQVLPFHHTCVPPEKKRKRKETQL